MKITVRYFASIREALGLGVESLDTQTLNTTATTLGQLRDALMQRPGAIGAASAQALARGRAVRMALNQVMVDESAALEEGCEVAFFPPVTGG